MQHSQAHICFANLTIHSIGNIHNNLWFFYLSFLYSSSFTEDQTPSLLYCLKIQQYQSRFTIVLSFAFCFHMRPPCGPQYHGFLPASASSAIWQMLVTPRRSTPWLCCPTAASVQYQTLPQSQSSHSTSAPTFQALHKLRFSATETR
jgi:hypothetical protein